MGWYQTMSAVLFANLLTAAFIYSIGLANKNETKDSKEARDLYLLGCVGVVMVMVFLLFGIHSAWRSERVPAAHAEAPVNLR